MNFKSLIASPAVCFADGVCFTEEARSPDLLLEDVDDHEGQEAEQEGAEDDEHHPGQPDLVLALGVLTHQGGGAGHSTAGGLGGRRGVGLHVLAALVHLQRNDGRLRISFQIYAEINICQNKFINSLVSRQSPSVRI
ncbi:hypothetical protein AVEN_56363-1 [Araneus ventricosus]|uniref:Uncharacterized protein n=1 Tax=Araneus ventricosus TaxID=182803 RepID=A0A4Y2LQT1_ARAVE|nr:hypothetical protein AVEN_56363-1 [Araneus ventricosus]